MNKIDTFVFRAHRSAEKICSGNYIQPDELERWESLFLFLSSAHTLTREQTFPRTFSRPILRA